jgi:hypothetical protein
MIMDASRLAIADASTALRRAEWECFAVDLRAKANALIESMLDDEDEIATRQALLDLALLNPVDHQFEIDTELFYGDEPRPAEAEGEASATALRSLDDDLDASRG